MESDDDSWYVKIPNIDNSLIGVESIERKLGCSIPESAYSESNSPDFLFSCEESYDLLLKLAHQQTPMSFYHVFTNERVEGVKKIGEGAYSDVFGFNKEDTVIKLIPFGGTFIFHRRKQLRVHQMLTEVIATQAVSQLSRTSVGNCTQNFVQLKGISVLTGSMPSFLLSACSVFERNGKCRGYKIDSLPEAQKWVAMEFNDCGHTLHGELPSCAVGRLSVFAQTVLAMAVAERQLCLEHRDLHMDNVLIRPRLKGSAMGAGCDTDAPSSTLDGIVHQPCAGPPVSIIDFTFSRLNMNATYLSSNKTLLKEVQNGTSSSYEKRFKPRGNCIWLGVIAEYLKTAEPTVTQCEVHHSSFTNVETKWDAILNLLKTSKSAVDFVKRAQIEAKFLFL